MNTTKFIRIAGACVFLLGIVLFLMGINASQVFVEKMVKKMTGSYSNETLWYMIGGIASVVAGAALAIFGGFFKKFKS